MGRRKYRRRRLLLNFTSEKYERIKASVNSCIRYLDGIGMNNSSRGQEEVQTKEAVADFYKEKV